MRIEYHPLTVSELNNAVVYYNQQRARLGDELRTEVYATIDRVRASPLQYTIIERGMPGVSRTVSHTLSCFASLVKTQSACWSFATTVVIQASVLAVDRHGIIG